MNEISEYLNDELILIEEDPDGWHRRVPSWVAREFDPGRRAGILSALRRYGYGDGLSFVGEDTEEAMGPFPDAA